MPAAIEGTYKYRDVEGLLDIYFYRRVGFALAVTLKRLYPKQWQTKRLNMLMLNEEIHLAIERGAGVEEIMSLSKKNLEEFLEVRKRYLLY